MFTRVSRARRDASPSSAMEVFKNFLTLRPVSQSAETAVVPYNSPYSLQSQFEAQTVRLRENYKIQRLKNTVRAYEPKQKEWEDWCARLEGNPDGAWVTEDKLCLFLEQEVVNRESRASGYQKRKAKRKEMWKSGERASKRRKKEGKGEEQKKEEEEEKEEE